MSDVYNIPNILHYDCDCDECQQNIKVHGCACQVKGGGKGKSCIAEYMDMTEDVAEGWLKVPGDINVWWCKCICHEVIN